jgi:hypothetical protein
LAIFDNDLLSKNLKKFQNLYLKSLSESSSFSLDESNFVLSHQKLKTPVKLQPFGARAGPMHRRLGQQVAMNPPAPPSKR